MQFTKAFFIFLNVEIIYDIMHFAPPELFLFKLNTSARLLKSSWSTRSWKKQLFNCYKTARFLSNACSWLKFSNRSWSASSFESIIEQTVCRDLHNDSSRRPHLVVAAETKSWLTKTTPARSLPHWPLLWASLPLFKISRLLTMRTGSHLAATSAWSTTE
jgi:hypothetical protein